MEWNRLVLEGHPLRIRDGFEFENEVRSPEGKIFSDKWDAVTETDRPVFTPTSSKLSSGIVPDNVTVSGGWGFYWLKEGTVGEITRFSLSLHRGERAPQQALELLVGENEFQGKLAGALLQVGIEDNGIHEEVGTRVVSKGTLSAKCGG